MRRHSLAGPKQQKPWSSRIVGYGMAKAGQLMAHPLNWRTHSRAQEEQLTGLLHDVGFVQSIIVNRRTSPMWGEDRNVEVVVDGHLRVTAALARGEETELPVVYIDVLPEEERRILLQLDPIGAMAGRDDALLRDLSDTVATEWPDASIDLGALLDGEREPIERAAEQKGKCTCCAGGNCQEGCGCWHGED